MAKLLIAREVLTRAKERSNLTRHQKAGLTRVFGKETTKAPVSIEVKDLPLPFLRALLDDARLTPSQRALVSLRVHGMTDNAVNCERVYEIIASNPVEFGSAFITLDNKSPNCETFLNGRWYPVILSVEFVKDEDNLTRHVRLVGNLSLCEYIQNMCFPIYRDLFLDDAGQARERTVLEVLQFFGLRPLETSAGEFNLKLVRAERASRETGQVVLVSGPVMAMGGGDWWPRLESRALGTPAAPRKAIVEPELEVAEKQRHSLAAHGQTQRGISRLPFVRLFSLDTKGYVYADVDDIMTYEFDTNAMSRLHLPKEMLSVLGKVFHTPIERLFGDLVRCKHGGVVILAHGSPGVGKTLTAEVYAEETQRPLYVLELGELGTNVASVEKNLARVFARVARWNAVLQFDECEIFLTRRGEDLERSAIVGSFLRLLDYYQGILFLTTNRADVLDHAILSRVMIKLHYPDLDHSARTVIWKTMFEVAELTLTEGSIEELAEEVINGRQIRNLTRLARILYPEGQVTLAQMRDVLRHNCMNTTTAGGGALGVQLPSPAPLALGNGQRRE